MMNQKRNKNNNERTIFVVFYLTPETREPMSHIRIHFSMWIIAMLGPASLLRTLSKGDDIPLSFKQLLTCYWGWWSGWCAGCGIAAAGWVDRHCETNVFLCFLHFSFCICVFVFFFHLCRQPADLMIRVCSLFTVRRVCRSSGPAPKIPQNCQSAQFFCFPTFSRLFFFNIQSQNLKAGNIF